MTAAPPPHCLMRLSFDRHDEYLAYCRDNAGMLVPIFHWHESLGNRAEPLELPGICEICECRTMFSATPQKAPEGDQVAFRVPWWSRLLCDCGMNTLNRAVVRILVDDGSETDRVFHVGHHSFFRHWLSQRLANVVSSEYAEGREPGEIDNGVRYEDLTRLTFPDQSFDCVICMEILEHIPDYQAALREMARTLKPGGRAILSFPWLGGRHYDHQIRAEVLPDGSLRHLLPAEYHLDPTNPAGILSFRSFGWKILDEIRSAGFARASARYVFGPLHGYMTLATPVVVGVR